MRVHISLIAAMFLATGTAHAAEIPKQYHGKWCTTQWQTIFKRCPSAEFLVDRTSWGFEDEYCTLSAIRKSKYGGHILSGVCHRDEYGGKSKRGEEHWWLGTNNTRLQIIGRNSEDK